MKSGCINNVYFPFSSSPSIGGPATFMANLKKYMDERNLGYSTEYEHAKGIFFPVQIDEKIIEIIKKNNGKVIQRLDGVYYSSKHGDTYIELNKSLKNIYLNYADHVIFQSEYSRKQCFEMLGVKEESNYTVIHNGVHNDIFYPPEKHFVKKNWNLITTGNFRNIDMLEPVTCALDGIKTHFEFKLHVIGPLVNPDLNKFLDRDYVVYHGPKSISEVAGLLRNSDIFIYSHLNPPCPNSVLEAVSSGIPVVGFDSGAMGELCWFSRDLLAYVSGDTFQKYEDFIPERLAEKIELCVNNYNYYREISQKHTGLYSFEECGARYVEVFEYVFGENDKIDAIENCDRYKPMGSWIKKKIDAVSRKSIARLNDNNFICLMLDEISRRVDHHSPSDALRLLFDIDDRLYQMEGRASIRYGNGLHTKHKHTRYHDFFIQNIKSGSRVLDVGCGNGALAADIADNVSGSSIYAIDIVPGNISQAESLYKRATVTYICGDALTDLPNEGFDVIVLSNVLEHIEKRIEFLFTLNNRYKPGLMLIRVPCFDRDWRVPLKKEIDMDYRLDKTHCIEYRYEEFENEIDKAGLYIESARINWGEIWAVVKSSV